MRCEICKHAGPPAVGTHDRECHRYPPVPVMIFVNQEARVVAFFPKVAPAHVCGEWASKIAVA
jgi:hypothetical protein